MYYYRRNTSRPKSTTAFPGKDIPKTNSTVTFHGAITEKAPSSGDQRIIKGTIEDPTKMAPQKGLFVYE